jgi:hypothetical protein
LRGELIIPEFVIEIGDFAFENNANLMAIEFEPRNNNLSLSIGYSAFQECDLIELNIPKFITKIGKYSFSGNPNLTKINFEHRDNLIENLPEYLPKDLTESDDNLSEIEKKYKYYYEIKNDFNLIIENSAFYGCDLEELIIPPFIKNIECCAFSENTNLKSIKFEPRVNNLKLLIGNVAFAGCDIIEVIIPSFVIEIGARAFALNKNLTSIKFEPSLEHIIIGQYAFLMCNITGEFIIPKSVSTIERCAFAKNKNLTSIVFEHRDNNLELIINNYAFYRCNIQKLIIPPFVKYIGASVFSKNDQLSKIIISSHIIGENYEFNDDDNDGYDEYYLDEYEDVEYEDEYLPYNKYSYKDVIFGDTNSEIEFIIV